MSKQAAPIQFRSADLAALIAARGNNPNEVARRDLERYYALLAQEATTLPLSSAERAAVADATISTAWTPDTIRHVHMGVDDAIRLDGLADRHGIDGPALVAKLRALTPGQAFALVDLIGRDGVGR